jgi:hypothetical protein
LDKVEDIEGEFGAGALEYLHDEEDDDDDGEA